MPWKWGAEMARLMGLVTPLAHLISLQLFFFGVKNLAGTGHLVACKTLVSYLLEKKHITIRRLLLEQCL